MLWPRWQPSSHTCAWRIRAHAAIGVWYLVKKESVELISGDTRPSERLVSAAKGVDVLVHEVYSAARLAPEKRPGGEFWPQYMRAFHTSDIELGRMAIRIQPKLLILYHIVRTGRPTNEELLAGVIAGGYKGQVVIGNDLERY